MRTKAINSEETDKNESGRNPMRFSIVYKLNFKLWLGLLGIFLILDLVLISAFSFALVFRGESLALDAVTKVESIESLSPEEARILSVADITITPLTLQPTGAQLPTYVQRYLPEATRQAHRRLSVPRQKASKGFFNWFNQVTYKLEFAHLQPGFALTVELTPLATSFYRVGLVILIMQGWILIQSAFSRARTIRKTLRPITELANKARSLNVEQGPFTPEKMQALAGTLDGINAARLDTRIEVGATQDELKNLAAAINGMLDRINEAYGSQARFVSDASHELRTPIAAIQGYANLLDRWGKYDEKALQESIDAIKEEAANMKELIEQLLFLARGDNHRMHVEFVNFDLAQLAETVIKETEMISDSHILTSQLQSVTVLADQGLIKQAIRILVDNGVKYTPVGGRIGISVSLKDENACLTVQDEGIGIPAEAVPYIFERFYRADESRARKTGGTGLGLSIAKWIAQRHGGYMEVLSREEVGTKISLVIPASGNQDTSLVDQPD